MVTKSEPSLFHFRGRTFIQIIIVIVAAVILVPKLNDLFENRQVLNSLSFSWLLAGLAAFGCSYIFAALVYAALSLKSIHIGRALLVQIATGFTNRLLPSGIGGMGTNALFLTRSGYKRPAAISLTIANNFIGFIALVAVILVSGVISPDFLGDLFADLPTHYIWGSCGLLLVLAIITLTVKQVRRAVSYNFGQSLVVFRSLASRPDRLSLALFASIGITASLILALYCCLKSAGVTLPLQELILVFVAGVIAIGVSPTPGGLGASELAMTFALSQLGVGTAPALAAVVAYRIVSFWLPIVPGYMAFRFISARKYI